MMAGTAADVTLCVVNYNGADRIVAALEAALAQQLAFAEILVVDNASVDDSVAVVRRQFPQVRVIQLPENRGPGAARNAGFSVASGDLILFQDNDISLQPGCAERLLAVALERPNALLVAPRVLYEQHPTCIQYEGADCHFLGLLAPRHADRNVSDVTTELARTTSLITACFLMHRGRWSGGAPFDEGFAFNLEDHDLGVRATLWGHEVWVEPHAAVRHGSGTPGLSYRPGYSLSSQRMHLLVRNRWFIMMKSYSLRTLLLLMPLLILYEIFQVAGLARKGCLPEWGAAVATFIRQFPALLESRAKVQALRRVPDRLILKEGPLPLTGAMRAGVIDRTMVRTISGIASGYWWMVRPFV